MSKNDFSEAEQCVNKGLTLAPSYADGYELLAHRINLQYCKSRVDGEPIATFMKGRVTWIDY